MLSPSITKAKTSRISKNKRTPPLLSLLHIIFCLFVSFQRRKGQKDGVERAKDREGWRCRTSLISHSGVSKQQIKYFLRLPKNLSIAYQMINISWLPEISRNQKIQGINFIPRLQRVSRQTRMLYITSVQQHLNAILLKSDFKNMFTHSGIDRKEVFTMLSGKAINIASQ